MWGNWRMALVAGLVVLGLVAWIQSSRPQMSGGRQEAPAPAVVVVPAGAAEPDVVIPIGPEHREAVAGLPEVRRWRPVTLGVDRQRPPAIGSVLRFAPFDDHVWRCRVRTVRPVDQGVAINADALDEPGALLMVEVRAEAVVVRLDRRGAAGVVVGHLRQSGLVATEWQAVAAQAATDVVPMVNAAPPATPGVATHAPGCLCAAHRPALDNAGHPLAGMAGGPDFTTESLPDVPLRRELRALPAAARERAERALSAHPCPAQDLTELHADTQGALFYACRMTPALTEDKPVVAATTTAAITFDAALSLPLYHSRSSQTTRVEFLDFDGFTMPANTAWGSSYSGKICKPYSIDSDLTTFSNAELAAINLVWQQVSEIYAPFDIDVTTEQPSAWTDYTGHVLITATTATDGTTLPHYGYGGIAYVGVYGTAWENYGNSTVYQPAFVTAYTSASAIPYMAQSAAHEFGHQLNLHHDGTSSQGYYGGHASGSFWWGPVMGGGYVLNIAQWSKGGYYDANNSEDDLAIIASSLGYVADDHGGTNATATSVTVSGTSVSGSGVISQSDETDRFRIVGGAGTWTFTCTPALLPVTTVNAALGITYNQPVLDVQLVLYDSSGAQVASTTAGTAMATTLNATVASAGTYYLEVRPTGVGSPTASSPSGFTSYGSLGTYTWSGTVPSVTMPSCVISLPSVATIGAGFTATWTFSEAVSGFTADDVNLGGGSASATISDFSGSGTTYTATITPTGSGSLVVAIPAAVATSIATSADNASASASVPVAAAATTSGSSGGGGGGNGCGLGSGVVLMGLLLLAGWLGIRRREG